MPAYPAGLGGQLPRIGTLRHDGGACKREPRSGTNAVESPATVEEPRAVGTELSELPDRHITADSGKKRFERRAWLTFCVLQASGVKTV